MLHKGGLMSICSNLKLITWLEWAMQKWKKAKTYNLQNMTSLSCFSLKVSHKQGLRASIKGSMRLEKINLFIIWRLENSLNISKGSKDGKTLKTRTHMNIRWLKKCKFQWKSLTQNLVWNSFSFTWTLFLLKWQPSIRMETTHHTTIISITITMCLKIWQIPVLGAKRILGCPSLLSIKRD